MIDLGINLFQEIAALGGGGGGFSISNSLRFNDDDSAYLSRTPSSTSDTRTWTWSGWVKRGNIGVRQFLFSAGTDGNNHTFFRFNSTDDIYFITVSSGVVHGEATTLSVLRDPSGWYHITVAFDASNAVGSNRLKIYVNGEEQPISITDTIENNTNYHKINQTNAHNIGARAFVNTSDMLDAYLADVNFIDGQALTADDFGQIDETTGEWSPKRYSGTYGTNGFYLAFGDGAALGDDTSGNTNDWTPTNLASTDQMLDTPTNNFGVLNPLATQLTLSEGNLKSSNSVGAYYNSTSTIGMSSGKWYTEVTIVVDSTFGTIGITTDPNLSGYAGSTTTSWSYNSRTGDKIHNGSVVSYGSTYTTGDVIGIALDLDSGTLSFYKNNVFQGTAYTGLSGTFYFVVSMYDPSTWVTNFGQDSSFAGNKTRQGNTDENGIGDFYYTPPTGYLALCTDNLPEPAIVDSETQFNVVTYTGDNTLSRTITGVGFEPDFVWIKRRNQAASHALFDSVRGATKMLSSDLSDVEATRTDTLTSFDSDGFTVSDSGFVNDTADTYVAWCWKAGGTAVTNNDGSITSQVSANVDAGFSIVSYTGNSTSGATIGHGLNSAPEVVIVKARSVGTNWHVYTKQTGATNVLLLDSNAAVYTGSATWWNNTNPNSTVVTLGNGSGTNSSSAMIAYCFHSVDGFIKFGSYVGNGSSNGPFVYTGFRPAFVLVKVANSTGNWVIVDNERSGYNIDNKLLYPNLTNTESTGGVTMDLLSNGFKLRSSASDYNALNRNHIYMAFAEAPFKNALAR